MAISFGATTITYEVIKSSQLFFLPGNIEYHYKLNYLDVHVEHKDVRELQLVGEA